MSVESVLGGWEPVEALAGQRWPCWAAVQPGLDEVADVREAVALVGDRGDVTRSDAVLSGLVWWAAVDGGDDEVAAHVVALLLAPSARGIAVRLARQERISLVEAESVVAGQLWLHARTYPWRRRPRAVAVNILWDARRASLRELDPRSGLPVDPARQLPPRCPQGWLDEADQVPDPTGQTDAGGRSGGGVGLWELLQWAASTGRICGADRDLVWDLVVTATAQEDLLHTPRRGLCSVMATESVASRWGMSGRSVRRRRDHVVAVLAAARGEFLASCA